MKITDVEAYNLTIPYEEPFYPAWQPGLVLQARNFTFVIVRTSEGISGYAGADGHVAALIQRSVKPYLVGESIWATERHARVYRNARDSWCVDMAVWDIIGKVAGQPLHRLWGTFHEKLPAYASMSALGTPSERADLAQRFRDQGFVATKMRIHHEKIADDIALVEAVRKAVPGMTLMVDCNQPMQLPSPLPHPRWDYIRALKTARELEQLDVFWMEEPLPYGDWENLARLTRETDIYIAGGELNTQFHEFKTILEMGCYDIIQPDCTMSEGISQMRKIAGAAQIFNRHFVPHHGVSGLGFAATANLCFSTPGMMWLELMYEPSTRSIETYQQLGGILESKIWIDSDGYVAAPTEPGIGVVVNEKMIQKYVV